MLKQTEKYCIEIKKSGLPTFIWGARLMAHMIQLRLAAHSIAVDGFVVDDSYAVNERGVLARSYVIENYEEYNIVCGHIETFYKSEAELRNHWAGVKNIFFFPDIFDVDTTEAISEEFYNENREKYDAVRDILYDEFSKNSLDAYLNEKISGDYQLLLPYVVYPQYFFKNAPWKYSNNEVLLDCGAYDGDSIKDFIAMQNNYKKIIACEPDRKNYKALLNNIEKNGWKSIAPYRIGVSDEKKVLVFHSSGDCFSRIGEGGEEKIDVEAIDHLLNGERVSIIKMDIEGAEMEALKGAEMTLRRCRPILMISAYHKKDDIYNIFEFVNNRLENYHYFFRCHRPHPIDAVLYAVPNERIREL